MDKDLVREIARRGGRAAQEAGTAHRFQEGSEEARRAGSLGGKAMHARRCHTPREGA